LLGVNLKFSRRRFIILLAAVIAAAFGLTYLSNLLKPRVKEEIKGVRKNRGNVYIKNGKSLVAIAKGIKDPRILVRDVIEALGGLDKLIKPGDKVVIKPNVGFRNPHAVVSPLIVAELVALAYEAGAGEVIVAESSVRGTDTTSAFEKTGYFEHLKNVKLIDLKKEGIVKTLKVEEAYKLEEVKVYSEIFDSDVLISVAKMKRHSSAIATLGMKNLIGCFPDDEKGRFHRLGLHYCIADIAYILRPELVVIDATEAMTVSGPSGGKMVKLDTVIASGDIIAADFISAKILFETEEAKNAEDKALNIPYIKLTREKGLGVLEEDKIELVYRELG